MSSSRSVLRLLPLLLMACNGNGTDSGDGTQIDPDTLVPLADDQNFSYVGDLSLTSTVTAQNEDLHFDWSDVATYGDKVFKVFLE